MKKLLAIAGIIFLCNYAVAEAQQRQYQGGRGGYSQQYRGGGGYRPNGYRGGGNYAYRQRGGNVNNSFNRNVYVKNNGWGGGGWGWGAAGLGLGLLGGMLLTQPSYAYPPPVYNTNCQDMWVWDQYGRKVLRTVCP